MIFHAELRNGNLIVRVGGGYMAIAEFIERHYDAEVNKVEREKHK